MIFWSNDSDCEKMEVGRFENIVFTIDHTKHHDKYGFSSISVERLKEVGYKIVEDIGYFNDIVRINEALADLEY